MVEKECIQANDLETGGSFDDSLDAEISKLETTLNDLEANSDFADLSNCNYELEEGEILDSVLEAPTERESHSRGISNRNIHFNLSEISSTDGEKTDSDIEIIYEKQKGRRDYLKAERKVKTSQTVSSKISIPPSNKIKPGKKQVKRKRNSKNVVTPVKHRMPKKKRPVNSKLCSVVSKVSDNSQVSSKNIRHEDMPDESKTCLSLFSRCGINQEYLFRTDSDDNIIITRTFDKTENKTDVKESVQTLPPETCTEEKNEVEYSSQESYLELDVTRDLEDLLLYPESGDENINIACSTPRREDKNSHKIWVPTFLSDKEKYLVLDECGEFSDHEQVSQIVESPVHSLDQNVKTRLDNTNYTSLVQASNSNNNKSVANDMISTNAITNIKKESTKEATRKVLERPKSTSPNMFGTTSDEDQSISPFKKAKKNKFLRRNSADSIESFDSEDRHVAFKFDGNLKVVINVTEKDPQHSISTDHENQELTDPPASGPKCTILMDESKTPLSGKECKSTASSLDQNNDCGIIKDHIVATSDGTNETSAENIKSNNLNPLSLEKDNQNKKSEPENNNEAPTNCKEETNKKLVSRHDADFISNDPRENADNNNPEWELLRKLDSDAERYRAMRRRWKNLIIPDPNKDITYQNYRKKHFGICHNDNDPFFKSSAFSCGPSVPTCTVTSNELKADTAKALSHSENRKRLRSADSVMFKREQQPAKRPRTQSCTAIYDAKLEHLRRSVENERQRINNEEQMALIQLNFRQAEEFGYLQRTYHSQDAVNHLLTTQLGDVEQVHRRYDQARQAVETKSMNKFKILQAACEEVKAFNLFYRGLDSESGVGDTLFLSDPEVQEIWDTERMYEEYSRFYSD